ncbi:MAG: flagellar basal-body rod protein FlgG [Phycisphaerales bacterium]
MAITALHSAATGLSSLSMSLDVTANNLANANTVGFKASRSNFEDLLYLQKAQPGVENAIGDMRPAGIQVGLGTRMSNTQADFTTGSPQITGQDFDMMIQGDGFFKVAILPDQGGGFGYTRAGNFFRNNEGDLVLGNSNGPRLDPAINVPEGITQVTISQDGVISGVLPGGVEPTELGQLQIATFVNRAGLESIGGNIFTETVASGAAIEGAPGEGTLGTIQHKALESSNVDPVIELISLIKTQRAFEMNSQTIKAADEALQVIGNLSRF